MFDLKLHVLCIIPFAFLFLVLGFICNLVKCFLNLVVLRIEHIIRLLLVIDLLPLASYLFQTLTKLLLNIVKLHLLLLNRVLIISLTFLIAHGHVLHLFLLFLKRGYHGTETLHLSLRLRIGDIIEAAVIDIVIARVVIVAASVIDVAITFIVPTVMGIASLTFEFLNSLLKLLVTREDFMKLGLSLRHLAKLLNKVRVDRLLKLIGLLNEFDEPVTVGRQIFSLLQVMDSYAITALKDARHLIAVLDYLICNTVIELLFVHSSTAFIEGRIGQVLVFPPHVDFICILSSFCSSYSKLNYSKKKYITGFWGFGVLGFWD